MKLLGFLFLVTIPYILGQCTPNEELLAHISHYCSAQQGGGSVTGPPRVGKAGPRGISGAKGEPGIVNYDAIDRKITEKFVELNTNVNTRLAQFGETQDATTQCCQDIARLEKGLQTMRTEMGRMLEASGWRRASNGNVYKFVETARNWQDAKSDCGSKGAILASVGVRNSSVRGELISYGNNQQFWIGLSDIEEEGRWMWEDGVESTGDDVGWNTDEPNNYGGNEDCAILFLNSNTGIWVANDIPCTDPTRYICEKIL